MPDRVFLGLALTVKVNFLEMVNVCLQRLALKHGPSRAIQGLAVDRCGHARHSLPWRADGGEWSWVKGLEPSNSPDTSGGFVVKLTQRVNDYSRMTL